MSASLSQRFPARDVATRANQHTSRLYETRYEQAKHAAWKRVERARFADAVAATVPNVAEARVLILDGHKLLATKALQRVGVQLCNIHVPNWEAGTIASKHPARNLPLLYGASLSEFLRACDIQFDAIWLDTCCQCTDAQLEDIRYIFDARLLVPRVSTLLYATYCGKREKKGNARLLRHANDGITRWDNLRLLMSSFALASDYYYAFPTESMAVGTRDHGMFTAAVQVVPSHRPRPTLTWTKCVKRALIRSLRPAELARIKKRQIKNGAQ